MTTSPDGTTPAVGGDLGSALDALSVATAAELRTSGVVITVMAAGAAEASVGSSGGTVRACVDLQPHAVVELHQHPHEQIVWMLKGKMEFRLGSERRVCGAGDIAVIPGGVEHEAWFPEDTEVIDVFAPPREDFLAGGTPAYMREG